MFARYLATGESSRIGVSSWMYESATFSSASSTPSLLDDLAVLDLAAERRAVVVDRRLEVVDGDGDVVDLGQQHGRRRTEGGWTASPKGLFRKESFGYSWGMEHPHRITEPREMRALAHRCACGCSGCCGSRVRRPRRRWRTPSVSRRHSSAITCVSSARTTSSKRRPSFAADGRERSWRAAQASTQWDAADFLDTPERLARVDVAAARGVPPVPDRARGAISSPRPRGVASGSTTERRDYWLALDAAGLKALTAELDAVIERYSAAPPPAVGTVEHVAVILHTFPGRACNERLALTML